MSVSPFVSFGNAQAEKYKAPVTSAIRAKLSALVGVLHADVAHRLSISVTIAPQHGSGNQRGARQRRRLIDIVRTRRNNDEGDNDDELTGLVRAHAEHAASSEQKARNETSELQENNRSQNPSSVTDFGLLSPSIDAFLDSLNSPPPTAADPFNCADCGQLIVPSMDLDMPLWDGATSWDVSTRIHPPIFSDGPSFCHQFRSTRYAMGCRPSCTLTNLIICAQLTIYRLANIDALALFRT